MSHTPGTVVHTHTFGFHGLKIVWIAFETPCGRIGVMEGGPDGLDEVVCIHDTLEAACAAMAFLEDGIIMDLAMLN